ncbi:MULTISPECIES: helix-turn-helix domain-containing protein [Sporomusa]|uniref:helix-turn-helix domain-containing protein n=1 Tax=Sporomusa TaxID=2375 RepID=UPI00166F136F|nr:MULTISPECIES: helix-turn-helix transcriptional regulator [Sporomusa]MCM0759086.1 helix-turn-helix domain-containing protein [Sporomusa sphaeroides DSM 2875]
MKTLGQKLKELRASLDLSQEKLSEELGISIKSIQRYETDKFQPDTYTMVKLATYFDVSTDYLLGLLAYDGELREIASKVSQNGKYNAFYSHHLKCKNSSDVDESNGYYWIHSVENRVIGGQTEWVGWLNEARTLEIRRLRPVIPMIAIRECTNIHGRPMLLNKEEDVIVFRLFGGHAVVKKEICEQYLPEFLEDFIART